MKRLLAIAALASAVACATQPATPTQAAAAWEGKLFAADAARERIVRAQSGEAVACTEPAFDDFVCMRYSDFESLYLAYFEALAAASRK